MPFAVTLLFDAATTSAVEGIWQTLASEIDEDHSIRGYPPHITVAAFQGVISDEEFRNAALLESVQSFQVRLVGLGAFPGQPFVIWAVPVVTSELLSLHATILSAFAHLTVHEHYDAGAWVPHVTLTQAPRSSRQKSLRPPFRPGKGRSKVMRPSLSSSNFLRCGWYPAAL